MDENWNKNKLVGNVAESIIEYLINSMPDWRCIKFGVEETIKDLKDMAKKSSNNSNPITQKIRCMPDFVAFNEKTGDAFLIEVKYNSNSERGYVFNYLERYNEYWEGTKLIIVCVDEPHFVCIDLKKIDKESMSEIKYIGKKRKPFWNFEKIEQGIEEIFPDLKAEDVKEAIRMIPKKDD